MNQNETTRKVIVFIASSLDGYIATEDDSLEWLFKVEGEGDNGYAEFYETVDTIIYGRRSYDWVQKMLPGENPYPGKKSYVITQSAYTEDENVEFYKGDLVDLIQTLNSAQGKNIWLMGGGNLIAQFIKKNLVDEFIITIAPTLIGKGIPLFKEQEVTCELELLSVRRFNQFAELHYGRKPY
jgi:dihydrofolate reductase